MLTKQKQQANQRPDAREVCLLQDYLFRTGTSVPLEPSQQCLNLQETGPREKTRKFFFVVQASTNAIGSMSSTDAFKKRVQRDDCATHAFRVVVRNPS